MANNPGVIAAILIEKSQMVKDTIIRIDREAGADDALFRKLIKAHFRPDLKAEAKVERRC